MPAYSLDSETVLGHDRPLIQLAVKTAVAVGFIIIAARFSGTPLTRSGGALNAGDIARLKEEAAVMKRFGFWSKALPPLLALRRAEPENHTYLAELAEVYGRQGRHREEASMWEQYMDRAPLPIEGCPQIGRAYQRQGLETQALAAYRRCLSIDPENIDSLFFLARALEYYGKSTEAERLYREGYTRRPAYADFGIGLARMQLRNGRPHDALKLAIEMVESNPKNSDALLVAGLAAERTGDRENAKRYLRRGAAVSSRDADLEIALGRLAEQEANLSEAIEHYTKVVNIQGAGSEFGPKLALLRKAGE
jgi:tetratricopeptide (TPR) repeat protein